MSELIVAVIAVLWITDGTKKGKVIGVVLLSLIGLAHYFGV